MFPFPKIKRAVEQSIVFVPSSPRNRKKQGRCLFINSKIKDNSQVKQTLFCFFADLHHQSPKYSFMTQKKVGHTLFWFITIFHWRWRYHFCISFHIEIIVFGPIGISEKNSGSASFVYLFKPSRIFRTICNNTLVYSVATKIVFVSLFILDVNMFLEWNQDAQLSIF